MNEFERAMDEVADSVRKIACAFKTLFDKVSEFLDALFDTKDRNPRNRPSLHFAYFGQQISQGYTNPDGHKRDYPP